MNQVTVLYDAFGRPSVLKRGWGYSAFVEHGGRRILFDTGNDGSEFAFNVHSLGIDLARLDLVVLSHRHGDHTSGLHQVLRANPGVKIYTPAEPAGFATPASGGLAKLIRRKVDSLPEDMRYFGGDVPERFVAGTPWPGAHFVQVREPTEVLPGVFLFSTQSDAPGSREMNEVSMALPTAQGMVVVVGCAHAGIERILEAVSRIDSRIHSVFGGFHLVDIADDEVTRMASRFRQQWHIERMAPGHCTGQFALSEILREYGPKFDRAGVGSVIALPN